MESWRTKHDELTGTWEIPEKSRYDHSVAVRRTYGTEKMEALHILEKTLNMKTVKVTTEIKAEGNSSGKKRVVDKGGDCSGSGKTAAAHRRVPALGVGRSRPERAPRNDIRGQIRLRQAEAF